MQPMSVPQLREQLSACPIDGVPALIAMLETDTRSGVQQLLAQARRRYALHLKELNRLRLLAAEEERLFEAGLTVIAGVDEVGRGALAGPVSAGACVLPRDAILSGLDDSKRLAPGVRERLYGQIAATALAVAVAHAEPEEIDRLGIGSATVLAMRRAIRALGVDVEHVLVDGRPVDLGRPCTAIVRGDATVRAISAAAVYAKVSRDMLMVQLDEAYPGYGLAGNKGYGSSDHLAAIASLGPSPIHRRSFAPCSQLGLF